MKELPYRQIHLDFHNSPFINDVGSEFDAEAFVTTLKEAHVNSINIFAKCHHGMCYYPTKYGKVHPSLKFDMFGEMVKALRKEDIQAIAYVPIGWQEHAADRSEWLEVSQAGVLGGKTPFETGHYKWRKLCLNKTEYMDQVLLVSMEILDLYEIGGFWYDIVFQEQCVCLDCQRTMKEAGLDPQNPDDVLKHDFLVLMRFQDRLYHFVKERKPDALVFFNGMWRPDGGYEPKYSIAERKKLQTHVEIESLPSEMWGYNHFPLFVNYHNRDNEELIGMNGKFHTAWGDFGSLRNQEALEFECFRMIANGSKISIGDQMHPRGYLDPTVYRRIGNIYAQIKKREPWCIGSTKQSQIGVIMANHPLQSEYDADEGVMRMMLELHYCFDFIDCQTDFTKYELLILPDRVTCDTTLAHKLSAYVSQGGKLLSSYHSGMEHTCSTFIVPELGVVYEQENEYSPTYLVIQEDELGKEIEPYEYALYEQGAYVKAAKNAEVLAKLGNSYFNRSYDRFCSHRHTPFDAITEYPAVVKKGNSIYIANPIFTDYIKHGPRVYRDLFKHCISLLLPEPFIKSDLPVSAEVTLRKQDDRQIVHILHYIAERKSRVLDIVDTRIPLYNRSIQIKAEQRPTQVYLAPSNQLLPFEWDEGYVAVVIPEIDGHTMVILEN